MTKNKRLTAFTLAEVLITLGVIGVVAALTMPTLLTNVQERVRKEQVRTVKYKFTKATDKMNSLGKIGDYGDDEDATKNFVNELKNHLSIAKVCENGDLAQCWPSGGFTDAKGDYTAVSSLTTGVKLEALQFNSGSTKTMGIVTGDGTPIILVYGKDCQSLDETKQYQWSVVDGKPETNATAGCVSMVFDINGAKGPNKLGTDVRTMNSLLGMVNLGANYPALSQADCAKYKNELGIKDCFPSGNDYWGGAVKACHDLGLHLASAETFAQIASLRYGITIHVKEQVDFRANCADYEGSYICKTLPENYVSPLSSSISSGEFWSSEYSSISANGWRIQLGATTTYQRYERRYGHFSALCLGD